MLFTDVAVVVLGEMVAVLGSLHVTVKAKDLSLKMETAAGLQNKATALSLRYVFSVR